MKRSRPISRSISAASYFALTLLWISGAFVLSLPGDSTKQRRAHIYNSDSTGAASPGASDSSDQHNRAPTRIISLAPVITETLFALGAGDRVVGVTRFCDRPVAASSLPKIGGFIDPQLEQILRLRPDLVIAMPSMGQKGILDQIRQHGIKVAVAFGDTVAEVMDLIQFLGQLVHATDQSMKLQQSLEQKMKQVAKENRLLTTKPKVLVLVSVRPLVAAGKGTFADEAIQIAGGVQAYQKGDSAWPTLSVESVLHLDPDIVVAAEGKSSAQFLQRQFNLDDSNAFQVVFAQDNLFMRPGPSLGDDIATLSRLLHEAQAAKGASQKQ
jgi:iron complex transport system substrate-binding protein